MIKQGLTQDEAKRKLASIQRIEMISPIEDADAIVKAKVLGWDVVVKKDEFKEGDLAVYFEIDSFLPEVDEYSFLGKARVNPITKGLALPERGYKLSTIKLRGQISQGLLISFDKLNNDFSGVTQKEFIEFLENSSVGTDVTKLLGVTKWEVPEVIGTFGTSSKSFPSKYTSKTDEERIQNKPKSYEKLKDNSYYASSKYDGTSITTIKDGNEIIIASRNMTLNPGSEIEGFLKDIGLYQKLLKYKDDIVLQGEFYGEGIQSNRLGIAGRRLAIFNIEQNGIRLGLLDMIKIAGELDLELPRIIEVGSSDESKLIEIAKEVERVNATRSKIKGKDFQNKANVRKVAPIVIDSYKNSDFNYSGQELLDMVNDMRYPTNDKIQEGVVFRYLENGDAWDPISFKAISNKFLLKYD